MNIDFKPVLDQPIPEPFADWSLDSPDLGQFVNSIIPDPTAVAMGDTTVLASSLVDFVDTAKATYLKEVSGIEAYMKHGNDHYRAMSVIQKCTRLADWVGACRAASALVNGGRAAMMWRRIAVIALEDVGVGGPDAASIACALGTSKELRLLHGDRTLSFIALYWLCKARKSRDLCDVVVFGHLPTEIDPIVQTMMPLSDAEVLAIALDETATFRRRFAASKTLGYDRPKHVTGWKKRPPEALAALYNAISIPPTLAFACHKAVALGGDAIGITAPVTWMLIRASSTEPTQITDPLDLKPDETPLIGSVPASSYDRHTYTGKRVLAYMLKAWAPWRDFFEARPDADPMGAVGRSIFYAEGGLLRPRFDFENGLDLYWEILDGKFRDNGLSGLKGDGEELLQITLDAIPAVNEYRQRFQ